MLPPRARLLIHQLCVINSIKPTQLVSTNINLLIKPIHNTKYLIRENESACRTFWLGRQETESNILQLGKVNGSFIYSSM